MVESDCAKDRIKTKEEVHKMLVGMIYDIKNRKKGKYKKMQTYEELVSQCGGDILSSPGMRSSIFYLQHGKVSVYDHSFSVAVMCLKLAHKIKLKTDETVLVRGALLHDYYLYDWHVSDRSHKWHGFTHPKKALQNAKRDFRVGEIEENMILCHMFPLTLSLPKYRESVILCVADKICAIQEITEDRKEKIKGRYRQ